MEMLEVQFHACDTTRIFFNISYLLFLNLTHKIEIGTTKGENILITTRLDQLNHLANQEVLGFAMFFANPNIKKNLVQNFTKM